MSNIMLDIETMGTNNEAAIISIGAVRFDGYGLGEEFYETINLESAIEYGGIVDGNTIMWWMNQSPVARKQFDEPGDDICNVLRLLSMRITKKDRIWGNGSDFDNVILASAYKNANIELPWKYYNNRCYRTIKNINKDVKMDRIGIHHSAIDDAKSQALHLIDILGDQLDG